MPAKEEETFNIYKSYGMMPIQIAQTIIGIAYNFQTHFYCVNDLYYVESVTSNFCNQNGQKTTIITIKSSCQFYCPSTLPYYHIQRFNHDSRRVRHFAIQRQR